MYAYLVAGLIVLLAGYLYYQRSKKNLSNNSYKSSKRNKRKLAADLHYKPETMSVVGVDLGNLNTVVAVARNRGIDVITNEVSNRATPSLVCLGEKQRYLGESAKTQEMGNFKSTVASLKRLLGRSFEDADLALERPFVNCNLVPDEQGQVCAEVMFQNESRQFTFTQLVAMFFTKVKEFTSAELKLPMSDVVVSCPGWFSDHQRRQLLAALQIANLNCLRIMNDLTAAALGYGITKTDLPDPTTGAKPRTVAFVDMGHSSFQVSIVEFIKGKLVVKGSAYDRHLGGRDFDQVLTKKFIDVFDKKYKMDIASSKKAVYRLRMQCEKVKKILSANAVTILNVECLMDDKDVSSQIDRKEFEEWIAPLVERMNAPLQQAIDMAGVASKDIDFVELIGGSTRVPLVKETLAKFFSHDGVDGHTKLATTLNQDEAVARGCALQCAIISPVFKVRDFSVTDYNSFPVQMEWASPTGGSNVVMDVFPVANSIPSAKNLTLYRPLQEGKEEKLTIDVKYTDEAFQRGAPEGVGKDIGQWTVRGIKKVAVKEGETLVGDGTKATIKLKAKLDGNGVVCIEQAQQIEEFNVIVKEEVKKEEAKKEEEKKEEEKKEEEAAEPEAPATDAMDTTPDEVKTKKVSRKYDLVISYQTRSLTQSQITAYQQLELEMQANDRLIIDTAEKRNALEEYVYDVRGKLEMAWSEYIQDAAKSSLMTQLNDMENWLYTEEGETATKSVYQEKLDGLKALGEPIRKRVIEAEQRPLTERSFREYVNSIVLGLQAEDGRYDHIEKVELDKVAKECQEKLNWLNDSIGKQNEKPKWEDVFVSCEDIRKTQETLQQSVHVVLSKPKPKPVPKEEKKEEADAAMAEDEKMDSKIDEPVEGKKADMDVD